MIIVGAVLALLIFCTLFILIISGNNMGTEEKGYFNVILITDVMVGILFLVFLKIDKKINKKGIL
jgi:Na+/melibiose symporter-like transporter